MKLLGFTSCAFLSLLAAFPASGQDRPNIMLIMADDMGFSDIGCFGSEIETPVLDRLASNGVVFTQFYNGARCCPTRAALMSGLYAHQTGMGGMEPDWGFPGYRGNINRECVTLAEALKANGYATFMTGKWHLTNQTRAQTDADKHNWPRQRGFDRFFGTISGGGSFYAPKTLTLENTDISDQAEEDESFYYTDAIGDYAVQFIDDHCAADKTRPFFQYISFTAPHWPLHALREDRAKYKGIYDGGWDLLRGQRWKRIQKIGLLGAETRLAPPTMGTRWEALPNLDLPKQFEQIKVVNRDNIHAFMSMKMEIYAAQIDRMDQVIGRIVKALSKHGIEENTMIVFLADNGGCAEYSIYGGLVAPKIYNTFKDNGGPKSFDSYGEGWACASNTPFRYYKHDCYEGGIATPMIVHWPAGAMADGVYRQQMGHIIDFMPTFLELARGKYPAEHKGNHIQPMEGKSLLAAITGNEPVEREYLCWEHHGNRAVRIGDWKLVARGKDRPWELYDMKIDRTEIHNLAKENPDQVDKMDKVWWAWAERCRVLPMNPNKTEEYLRRKEEERAQRENQRRERDTETGRKAG